MYNMKTFHSGTSGKGQNEEEFRMKFYSNKYVNVEKPD